jgi:adenylate kinase family enzyme
LLREQNQKLDKVLEFKIREDLLFERITGKKLTTSIICIVSCLLIVILSCGTHSSGRLVHPGSGRVYHTKYNPPKTPMKDDVFHIYTNAP